MDFYNYPDACAHFKDWNIDEVLDGNLDELIALGYDKDEAEFCYAVLTYKPDLIQKHIAMRTNPDVYISGEIPPGTGWITDGESYNALNCCNTFYHDAINCYGLAVFWKNKEVSPITGDDVDLLLEAAAYRDLEKKLKSLVVK